MSKRPIKESFLIQSEKRSRLEVSDPRDTVSRPTTRRPLSSEEPTRVSVWVPDVSGTPDVTLRPLCNPNRSGTGTLLSQGQTHHYFPSLDKDYFSVLEGTV